MAVLVELRLISVKLCVFDYVLESRQDGGEDILGKRRYWAFDH